jgi:hypothetical protein
MTNVVKAIITMIPITALEKVTQRDGVPRKFPV